MLRPMTKEEEVRLATVVTCRQAFGLPVAEELATKLELAPDLTDLVRAGITYEEVDGFFLGEEMDDEDDDEFRYDWSMPPAAGGAH
jgi:hypothetical protein